MTTTLAPSPVFRQADNNGNPLSGGQLFTYAAGTTTPLATYVDSTGLTSNTNPVILNSRGEASVWLTPNLAYKFQLQDALGNSIWTIDQIVNSQLLTLYGGVDSGVANAYVINFVANFTSYTDGILIYWIPSNTNTGASTININGIGVIPLRNFDGSAIFAGAIIANQPATILIKGGVALLISASTPTSGNFPGSFTGFSGPQLSLVTYRKNGTLITLFFQQFVATSNATSFQMSGIPVQFTPSSAAPCNYPIVGLFDNSAAIAGGMVNIAANGLLTFYKDGTQPNWTASGTKGFSVPTSFTYSL